MTASLSFATKGNLVKKGIYVVYTIPISGANAASPARLLRSLDSLHRAHTLDRPKNACSEYVREGCLLLLILRWRGKRTRRRPGASSIIGSGPSRLQWAKQRPNSSKRYQDHHTQGQHRVGATPGIERFSQTHPKQGANQQNATGVNRSTPP